MAKVSKWVSPTHVSGDIHSSESLFDPIKIITPYMISISHNNLFSMKMSLTQLPPEPLSTMLGPVARNLRRKENGRREKKETNEPAKARRQQKIYFPPEMLLSQPRIVSTYIYIYNTKWLYEWCLCSHAGKFFIRFFICSTSPPFALSYLPYVYIHFLFLLLYWKFPFGAFPCLYQTIIQREREEETQKFCLQRILD